MVMLLCYMLSANIQLVCLDWLLKIFPCKLMSLLDGIFSLDALFPFLTPDQKCHIKEKKERKSIYIVPFIYYVYHSVRLLSLLQIS